MSLEITKEVETSDIGLAEVLENNYPPSQYLNPEQAEILTAAIEIVNAYHEALVEAGEEFEEKYEEENDED